MGVDPNDGAQEAVVYGLEVEQAERGDNELTTALFLSRVHLRLTGRRSRLRKQRPLAFEPGNVFVTSQDVEGADDAD